VTENASWRRWLRHPQQSPLRKALFQVHLWLALFLGVYIVVISVSGSAVVFRRELSLWLVPRTVPSMEGVRLEGDALRRAAERTYAGYEIVRINERTAANRPVFVTLSRDEDTHDRLLDPYTGADLGHSFPPTLQAVEWLVDLHDNLLGGQTGRIVNGIGAALVGVVILTGGVLWWPGKGRIRNSLAPGAPAWTRRFAWRLHGAVGFWAFGLLVVWALTAVYFAFPQPIEAAIDRFDPDPGDLERPGEPALLALIQLHFGRFGGLPVRFLYVLLGLLPAVLFVTGFVMWWTRVVRPRLGPSGKRAAVGVPGARR
jgi:uncharacterized iron-regulated membrane protein